MPPKAKQNYYARLVRENSFQDARPAGSRSRAKKNAVSWPHSKPTVESMAAAGFYFDPALDVNDKTSCFMCFVSLDGWESGDDPLEEHAAVLPECSWVRVRSEAYKQLPESELVNSTYNPHSVDSFNARLDTFANWPHDKKKGWNPKSFNMAKAGFYFNPDNPDDDTASCTYCGLSLDGWEPKDEPIEEHRRRYPACLFFSIDKPRNSSADAESAGETTPTTTPAARGRRSTRGRTSKRSSSAMSDESDTGAATKKKRASSRTKKSTRKGSKQPTKGKARLSAFSDDEEQFGDATGLKPAHIKSPVKEFENEQEAEGHPSSVQEEDPEPVQKQAVESGVSNARKSSIKQTSGSADDEDDDDTGMVTANDIAVREEEPEPEVEPIDEDVEEKDDSVIEINPPEQQVAEDEPIHEPGQEEAVEEPQQSEPMEEQVPEVVDTKGEEDEGEKEEEPGLEPGLEAEEEPESLAVKQTKMPGAFPESREASVVPEPKKTKKIPKDSLERTRKKRTSAELEMEYGISSSSASPALIPTKSRKSAADRSTKSGKSTKSVKYDNSTTQAEGNKEDEFISKTGKSTAKAGQSATGDEKSTSKSRKPATKGKVSTKMEMSAAKEEELVSEEEKSVSKTDKAVTKQEKSVSKTDKSSVKEDKSTSKAEKFTAKSADKSTKAVKSNSEAKADQSTKSEKSTRSARSTKSTGHTRPSGMALLDEEEEDDDDDQQQEDTHKTLPRSSGMTLLDEEDLERRLTHVSEPAESENWTRLTSYDSPGSSPVETRKKAFALNTPPKQNDNDDDKGNEDPEEEQAQTIQTPAKEVRIVTPPEHSKWDAADPEMVFNVLQDIEPSFIDDIKNDDSLQDKTVAEWIETLADRAERSVNENAKRLIALVEEQGERAIKSVENLPVY